MPEVSKTLLSWKILEFEKHERSKKWWVWFIVIDLAVFIYAVVSANFLFALIVIMLTMIILHRHYHQPETIIISINEDGLVIGNRQYIWSAFDHFWLVFEPPTVKSLILSFNSRIKPALSIPLENQDPIKLREVLLKYLSEDFEKEDEPTTEALGRLLKL